MFRLPAFIYSKLVSDVKPTPPHGTMNKSMRGSFGKYKLVYSHLWQTYGQSGWVRLSYLLQLVGRLSKLVFLPIAIAFIVTRLSEQDYEGAMQAVFFYVSFSLLLGIVTPLIKYIGVMGENKVYRNNTVNYFSRLIVADMDYFYSNLTGYLTAATRQYIDSCMQMERAIRDKYINTVLSIALPLVVIMWLDFWLGLVSLGLGAVQTAYLLWASRMLDPIRAHSREVYKLNSGRMADAIANILAVRSSAQESMYAQRVREGAEVESEAFRQRYAVQSKLVAVREFITVTFFLVLLWLVVTRMASGHIDIGIAVLVVTYTTTILGGIYALSDDLDEHDDFVDKIIPAFEILDRQNKVTDPARPKKLDTVRGAVEFRDVRFAYDEKDSAAIGGFSLKIPKGQKLGVVGKSGAGKSTLTKLLLRFNDVDDGAIAIDGADIRSVRQTDLRRSIAYVPQEPLLFHASIRENIMLGRPDASEEDLQHALEAAHARHFVNQLPDGVESIVGERGVKLSGGQRQRIAIARAVLQDAPIMLLDEATSALDSESEQIIKNSFTQILAGKTAIVVAHRLSTLSEMDRIIVVDDGRLVEDGTHDELLASGGHYAKLWRRQLRGEEID